MWYVCDVMYAVLYARGNWIIVHRCVVSRGYIYVFYSYMFLCFFICTLTI